VVRIGAPIAKRGARWSACSAAVALLAVAAVAGAQAARARDCERSRSACVPAAVPSLQPAVTGRLWRRLVRNPRRLHRAADCRPLRAVFYAATDWLRLATKLAASASPCAEYYVSIPPRTSDKTAFRPDEARRIRALGSNFHALAEFHFTGWSRWVASNGSSWYEAGVEARRRMLEAGFDVAAGDAWAVNEFPSSVRTGAGAARANARELVRGLYEGDGTRRVRGTVFTIGIGQGTTNLSVYQTNVQNWLADTAFWTDMAVYVSDWSQEVYGDVRRFAVAGAAIATRRDYLNDYLQHKLVLARVAPPTAEPARTYLQSVYSPLANAAWQWESGYGWTMVPLDQMQAFVSAQTYALRYFSATTGQPRDHWGFAWQPRNATGLTASEFAAQTGAILDRLAAAVRDSGENADPADPGGGACGLPGQNVNCGGDVADAQFTEAWKSFRGWTQPVLALATPPQEVTAGVPSAAIGLALQTSSGAPQTAATPLAVRLASSSAQGQFSFAPTGPWTSTLTVTIPAGNSAGAPFYYLDTRAGRPQLVATVAGATTATQVETVQPGPPSSAQVTPATATLAPGRSVRLSAAVADAFGNPVSAPVRWSVTPTGLGSVRPKTGHSTTFTAGRRGGSVSVGATAEGAAQPMLGRAAITITPGLIRVSSITYARSGTRVRATARVVEAGGRPVRGARVFVVVRRNARWFFSGRARTGAAGRATFTLRPRAGCYRTTVTRIVAPGYRWSGKTPRNRFCHLI
jgi:hypothetical protein